MCNAMIGWVRDSRGIVKHRTFKGDISNGVHKVGQTCTITSVQKDNLVLEIYKYDIMTARNILHTLKCEPKEGGVAVLD